MKQHAILIKLQKRQITNDVQTECAIVGRTLQLSAEGEELGGNIMNPYSDLTRPVMARGMTEGFAEVKRICQRYLVMGKVTDDNRLERMDDSEKRTETVAGKEGNYGLIAGVPYTIKAKADHDVALFDADGTFIGMSGNDEAVFHTPAKTGRIRLKTESGSVALTYSWGDGGSLDLNLCMPCSFNMGMTEAIKSSAHRMIVDHVMYSILFNQFPEKAGIYKERFLTDEEGLRKALQARTSFGRHAEDWS